MRIATRPQTPLNENRLRASPSQIEGRQSPKFRPFSPPAESEEMLASKRAMTLILIDFIRSKEDPASDTDDEMSSNELTSMARRTAKIAQSYTAKRDKHSSAPRKTINISTIQNIIKHR